MRHIDVSKKRPARWPWLLGVGLLVLAMWGVTVLLRSEPEAERQAAVITAADTLPPAMIPSDTRSGSGVGEGESLTEDRIGERVRLEGEVVVTGPDMFWVLIDSRLLLVESQRPVRIGDSLSVTGTVRGADGATTDPVMADGDDHPPKSERWTVLRSIKLVEDDGNGATGGGGG